MQFDDDESDKNFNLDLDNIDWVKAAEETKNSYCSLKPFTEETIIGEILRISFRGDDFCYLTIKYSKYKFRVHKDFVGDIFCKLKQHYQVNLRGFRDSDKDNGFCVTAINSCDLLPQTNTIST